MSVERYVGSIKESVEPEPNYGISDAINKMQDRILRQKEIIDTLIKQITPILKPRPSDKPHECKLPADICECAARMYDISNLIDANNANIEGLINSVNI